MKISSLLLIVCWFLCSSSCTKDPDPEPDPCLGKNPVTADFHIYETFDTPYPKGWRLYDTDTVATVGVTFVALERNAKYEWRLGIKTIKDKSFYQENFPRGTRIPVFLKVIKTPDNDCFPEDSGIVTKTRWFYTTTYKTCQFPALKGHFRGYHSDNPDKLVTVEIDPCYQVEEDFMEIVTYTRMLNLEASCDLYKFDRKKKAYKQVFFAHGHYECNAPVGIIRVYGDNNDNLTVRYSIEKDPFSSERIFKTFEGTRIHN